MNIPDDVVKRMRHAYYQHCHTCEHKLDANGNPVKMLLSEEQWMNIWWESGQWFNRGCRKGQYVMSRFNDIGHYELGNVFIQLHSDNVRQAFQGKKGKLNPLTGRKRPEHAEQLNKACTIDGVTIYPSLTALIKALGQGKNGRRSPNFRYV